MTACRLRGPARRSGVAAVEFAVCLPVLVLIVFASIEACTMVFLKESLTVAAYEGGRVAIQPAATEEAIIARCQEILAERNVSGGSIELIPPALVDAPAGEPFEVRVSAPCASNAVIPVWFYGSSSMAGSSTFMMEH